MTRDDRLRILGRLHAMTFLFSGHPPETRDIDLDVPARDLALQLVACLLDAQVLTHEDLQE